MALTQMRFGPDSERAVRAQHTVAKAYLDLRGLPQQALKHATMARNAFRRAQEQHAVPYDPPSVALLEASILHTLGAAQVAVAAMPTASTKQRVGAAQSGPHTGTSQHTAARKTTTSSSSSLTTTLGMTSANSTAETPSAKLLQKARANLAKAETACRQHPAAPGASELAVRVHVSTAALHRQLDEFDDAATSLKTAISLLEADPPPLPDATVLTAELRRELATVEAARGQHDAAAEAREAALHAQEAQLDKHSTDISLHLLANARALMEVGDDAAAIGQLERALRILADAVPGGDPAALAGKIVCGINDDVPHLREWIDATDERAMLHVRLGEFREAMKIVKSVAPLKSELFGPRCVQSDEHLYVRSCVTVHTCAW